MAQSYSGAERRSSPDTIMLMEEIHKVAMVAATTSENVRLLRSDWSSARDSFITMDDINRVEKKVDTNTASLKDHVVEHTSTKRWLIGTIIAAIAIFISGIEMYFRGGSK